MLRELKKKRINKEKLAYKRLDQIRGYFCHLSMVFDVLTPYLKGFHLLLAAHLPQRDEQGWKFSDAEFVAHLEDKIQEQEYTRKQAQAILDASKTRFQDVSLTPTLVEGNGYFWKFI